ncbi:MAG TPA: hypothetical protein VGY55_16980 [Pirellulales bacterium]|nr:hypothetical protein [Pirellulales bacterium]
MSCKRKRCRGTAVLLISVVLGLAASPVRADGKGKWIPVSDEVIAQLEKQGKKIGWPGLTGGVGVDRANGDVYMMVCDNGLWKSADRGKSFERIDGGAIGGRCETGFALDIDPAGNRVACFPVYGPAASSLDAGKTWQKSTANHVDCIAVAWPDLAMLSIRHESGGDLIFAPDGGKTWKSLGKGFNGVGLFDVKTFVAFKDKGILRSVDGGANWASVSDLKPTGKSMRVLDGVGYWIGERGVLTSPDKGATWALLSSPVSCTIGPYFGKDANHLVVFGKQGAMETADAGKTWKSAAPLPPGIDGGYMSQFGWDPIHDVFYAGKMGQPTFKYER